MANFKQAFDNLIGYEGGYANNPNDIGKETYKGISRVYNPNWSGWQIVDSKKGTNNFPACLELSEELDKCVELFYQTEYWNKLLADNIQDQEIAELIFDFAVNAGIKNSVMIAQGIANTAKDGCIGINTVNALNSIKPGYFIPLFTLKRCAYYVDCVKRKATQEEFFYGWIKRSLKL